MEALEGTWMMLTTILNKGDGDDNNVDKGDDDDGNPVSRVGKSLMSAESVYTQIKQLMT